MSCEYRVETRDYSDNLGNIFVVTADEYELMYRAVDGCPTDSIILKSLHIATRKEIKAAGLWDYVINKEDYSSEEDKIETELDEYLRMSSPQRLNQLKARIQRLRRGNKRKRSNISERRMRSNRIIFSAKNFDHSSSFFKRIKHFSIK